MPGSLGEAVLDLTADPERLKQDIRGAKGDAQKALGSLGSSLQNIGGKLTAGLTLPIVGIGVAMINSASDVEESMNKVRVVFGDSADDLIKQTEGAAQAFGLSQQEALEAIGTYGNLFTALGVGQQDAADMSASLVGLAADLGSFNNIDSTVALEKLRAGLTGEAEPLKSLGVALRAVEVDARAAEIALADGREEISEADRIAARYAIILEQTASAQGDFANTADGLANSTKIAQAELKDEAATLGKDLLPLALEAVKGFRGLLQSFRDLSPETKSNILKFAGLAAVIGPLLLVLGTLAGAISSVIGVATTVGPILATVAGVLTGPVGLAIAAVVAAVGLLALAWKSNFLGIQETVATAWSIIQSIFNAFKAAFQGDWTAFGEFLREAWDTYWGLISERFEMAKAKLGEIAAGIVEKIKSVFAIDWGQLGSNIIEGIKNGLKKGIGAIKEAAENVAQAALDAAKGFLGIASESKVFRDQVGLESGAGVAAGFRQSVPQITSSVEGGMDEAVKRAGAAASRSRGRGRDKELIRNANFYNGMDLRLLAQKLNREVV